MTEQKPLTPGERAAMAQRVEIARRMRSADIMGSEETTAGDFYAQDATRLLADLQRVEGERDDLLAAARRVDSLHVSRLARRRHGIRCLQGAVLRMYERLQRVGSERDRLQQWVRDLQSGMYINCVYCGHCYGPADQVPATMADALKEHIEQCPKHPMSALKQERDDLRQQLADARADTAAHQQAREELAAEALQQLVQFDKAETRLQQAEGQALGLRGALGLAKAALDHSVPASCWATGPMTGDPIEDLVVCPGCRAIRAIDVALSTPAPPLWDLLTRLVGAAEGFVKAVGPPITACNCTRCTAQDALKTVAAEARQAMGMEVGR